MFHDAHITQLNQSAPVTDMELSSNASTTVSPDIVTYEELQRVVMRNLRALVRIFNMESRKAIEVGLERVSVYIRKTSDSDTECTNCIPLLRDNLFISINDIE